MVRRHALTTCIVVFEETNLEKMLVNKNTDITLHLFSKATDLTS